MFNKDYYSDLIIGEPINYKGLIIYPPKFKEIISIGVNEYNQIMKIYELTKECLDIPKEEINSINLFEDVFMASQEILKFLYFSLTILTKPKNIVFNEKSIILSFEVNSTEDDDVFNLLKKPQKAVFEINKDNFDDISDIILKINSSKKIEIERPPKNMSKRQLDVWNKLQEGRRQSAKKDQVFIYDIINICEFGGKYHIPINEISEWSLWKIMNCYKSIMNIKNYDDSLKLCLVSGDGKSISGNNHWHTKLMIRD